MAKFPFYKQLDQMDCGPTCLRIIAKHYGKLFSAEKLRERSFISREGVALTGIANAAESIGLRALVAGITFDKLKEESPLPCIVHWKKRHFIVVYKITDTKVFVSDPAFGLITYSREEFLNGWLYDRAISDQRGAALFLEVTPLFDQQEEDKTKNTDTLAFFFSYLIPHRKFFVQIILGLVVGGVLQLIFPFLTQSIVDVGINDQDIGFINIILLAQVMLFFSRSMVEFVRSWIMLHVGTRINISMISDFLFKLMKLPVSFFDKKMIGDLIQRIGDHRRIQAFISTAAITTLFSIITLVVFSIVLSFYSWTILGIFFTGSFLYVIWVLLFMKKRKELDYKFFQRNAINQSSLIQLIYGIQEIKLNNSERKKRWEWEEQQAQLFKMNITSLKLSQYQQVGSSFINEIKNIIITITSAKLVISGEITLGMMLSVQYIIGQLNGPVGQLIGFLNTYQDAKISLERLNEIHSKSDEQSRGDSVVDILPFDTALTFNNVSFRYDESPDGEPILKDLNFIIPHGKITAIVGASGSGKTTLLKLLLKFYKPTNGKITADGVDIWRINNYVWRENCGAVLQDGFIFTDTIANNIAISDEAVSYEKLMHAIKIANIHEFVESLPLGLETRIGGDGHGLSQGQRQRILIARAVYKNPGLIMFDEATSALDATNEIMIMDNLNKFFQGRTVLIAAHRLSTIKKADQIIVLDKGEIVEFGDHNTLRNNRKYYYKLIQNQLEQMKDE